MICVNVTPKYPLKVVMGMAQRVRKNTAECIKIGVVDKDSAFDLCYVAPNGIVMFATPTLQIPIKYLAQLAEAVYEHDLCCPALDDLASIIEDLKDE